MQRYLVIEGNEPIFPECNASEDVFLAPVLLEELPAGLIEDQA